MKLCQFFYREHRHESPDAALLRLAHPHSTALIGHQAPLPGDGVHGVTAIQRSVLVRVATESGHEGWGNVDPTPGYSKDSADHVHAAVGRLAPTLTAAAPFNIHAARARMDREAAVAYEAKAAVEMALVDLKARALGVPVHSLLGGRVKDAVTLGAWTRADGVRVRSASPTPRGKGNTRHRVSG